MTLVEHVVPTSPKDVINRTILEVSEDQIKGFVRNPMAEIAHRAGIDVSVVVERIQAMLEAGVIRRVRQTLDALDDGVTHVAEYSIAGVEAHHSHPGPAPPLPPRG